MKKLILLIVVGLMSCASYGQLAYGVKAGFNASYLRNSDLKVTVKEPTPPLGEGDVAPPPKYHDYYFRCNPRLDIYVGAFLEYRINSWLSVQPELVYSRQGGYMHIVTDPFGGDRGDHDNKTKFRINYFNIPLMVKFRIAQSLSVDVGPQFGIRINSVVVQKIKQYTSRPVKTKNDMFTNTFDVAASLGLTYYTKKRFDIHGRFNMGLVKVMENGSNSMFGKNKNSIIGNNVFQLGVGYRF